MIEAGFMQVHFTIKKKFFDIFLYGGPINTHELLFW